MRILLVIVFAISSLTCTESFPALEDPGSIFVTSIYAQYVLTLQENSVLISVRIKSNYDETIQEVADILGSVDITLLRNPNFRRTIAFSAGALYTSGKYNPVTRVLTVNPGDILRFDVSWDFRDDQGLYLPDSMFQYYEDPECPFRCVAEEEMFSLKGGVKLYDRTPRVESEKVEFSVCHIKMFIDGCPPVIAAIPCSKRPPDINPVPCY